MYRTYIFNSMGDAVQTVKRAMRMTSMLICLQCLTVGYLHLLDVQIGYSSGEFVDDTSVAMDNQGKRDSEEQDDVGDDKVTYNVSVLISDGAHHECLTCRIMKDKDEWLKLLCTPCRNSKEFCHLRQC